MDFFVSVIQRGFHSFLLIVEFMILVLEGCEINPFGHCAVLGFSSSLHSSQREKMSEKQNDLGADLVSKSKVAYGVQRKDSCSAVRKGHRYFNTALQDGGGGREASRSEAHLAYPTGVLQIAFLELSKRIRSTARLSRGQGELRQSPPMSHDTGSVSNKEIFCKLNVHTWALAVCPIFHNSSERMELARAGALASIHNRMCVGVAVTLVSVLLVCSMRARATVKAQLV